MHSKNAIGVESKWLKSIAAALTHFLVDEYIFGLIMFALPASFKIGVGNVLLATLIPPLALLVLKHVTSIERVREVSIALQRHWTETPSAPNSMARTKNDVSAAIDGPL
jgi:hypothetical protein